MLMDPFSKRLLRGAGLVPSSQGRGPVVLMYHAITPGRQTPASRWAVSEQSFNRQLELLQSEGWHTVLVRDLARPAELGPRSVAITFDDGYANNHQYGFLPLVGRGMKATWFIVSRDVGKDSGWRDADNLAKPMLSLPQLKEMARAGMEIGAHTRSHARLTQLDPDALKREIAGSKEDLERMLGLPVTSFAYPYGLFDGRCVQAARDAGFLSACTTRTGWLGSDADPYQIRRVAVFGSDSPSSFARKLVFADTEVSWRKMADYAARRVRARLGN